MANCTKCGTVILTDAGICGSCSTAVPAAWKFSWSPFIGIMYGPIPVGLIFAVIVLIAVYN